MKTLPTVTDRVIDDINTAFDAWWSNCQDISADEDPAVIAERQAEVEVARKRALCLVRAGITAIGEISALDAKGGAA